MQTISSFVEPYTSVFEQCLLSKDPQAHVATLPDSPEKTILNFLLQPHSQRFQEELIHKYNFRGELLQTLDQWKIQSKIADAKFPTEIRYLIDEHLKKYGNNYNFPRPAEFQSTGEETHNQEPTFPSELQEIQSLSKWALEQLNQNESSIFGFSKKAIISLPHDRLLKLSAQSKEAIFNSQALREYPDKFVVEFVKSYYDEQIKTNSSFEIPHYFYSNLSKSQFLSLKNSIGSLIHNNEYLRSWFDLQFQEELQNFTKSDLTISEKDELRKLLLKILKEVGEMKTPKVKPIRRNTLKQLIALDISREEVEKDSFEFFREYLENSTTSISYETASLREIRNKTYRDNVGTDDYLGHISINLCGDDELVQNFIELLLKRSDAEDYVKKLESLFDKKFVLSTLAKTKLGQGESLEKHQAHLTSDELRAFKEKREITIVPQNKRKWQAHEEVALKLRVKNVSKIHVQIYKLDLEKHFLENNSEIDQTQSFSYLQPNHEYIYSTQTDSPYIVQIYDVKIEGIPSERGVWVVELEGEGISSRAFIRKGALANINTNNSLGTELKFYDENGTQLEKYELWIEGKKHSVESFFTIPFGETEKNIDVIVTKDGYSEKFVVNVPREEYSLNISYIYNTESFIVGSIAKVLLHPTLRLSFDQTLDVNFKLLEKVKILVSLTNNLGIRSTIDFDNVQFKATEDYVLEFPVQSFTSSIEIAVSGKVKKYNKKEDNLVNNHLININLGEDNLNFNDVYLRNGSKGYTLSVLGKNGEPSPYTQVVVRYQIDGINEEQSQNLQTTKEGTISLGSLRGVEHLTAEVSLKSGTISRNWSFNKLEELDISNEPIFREAEEVVFPTNSKEKVQLWRVNQANIFLDNVSAQIHQEETKIVIKGLQKGRYALIFPESGAQVNFSVVKSKKWGTESQLYDEQAGMIFEVSSLQNNHISIGAANFKKQENQTVIQIPIQATYDITKDQSFRAHLLASNFVVPNFNGRFSTAESRVFVSCKLLPFEVKHSEFYNNKKLSEESSYAVNRKNEKKYIGNNLEKPKLFLKRIEVRETTQKDEVLEKAENYNSTLTSNKMRSKEMAYCCDMARNCDYLPSGGIMNPNEITTQNNFLSLPGTLIANQKGNLLEFVVPEGYSHFECVVFNKKSSIIKRFDLPTDVLLRKSIPHSGIEDLNQETAKTMSREVYKVAKGESIKVGRDSIWSAVGLSNVVGFSKIKGAVLEDWVSNWNGYSNEEKLSVYDEKVCHELNSYIKYNDGEFFAKIVEPFIKNKVTKTFVDLALLNHPDTLKYASLSLINELNEFEKVLLVEQLVLAGRKDEAQAIVSAMENKNKSNRISFENFKKQFDTVITAKLTEEAQQPASLRCATVQPMSYGGALKARKAAPMMKMMVQEESERMDKCLSMEQEEECFLEYREKFVNDFKEVEKTKEFTETTYSGVKNPRESKSLVRESPFWASAAQHFLTGTGTFLSENFMYLQSKIEFTLAASFIPNQKLLEYGLKNQDDNVIIEASSNFLVFVREVKSLPYERKFGVLLNQRFFNPDDRFYYEEDGTRIEKETDQFVARRPYCVQTLITNTSGTRLELQLLIDIPEGSIPLKSHENTNIQSINLEPYSTLSFERYFYFPASGSYRLYPSNACRGGLVIAKSEQLKNFEVSEKEVTKTLDTLENVLKSGNKEAVLSYLETKNVFDSKIFEPSYILWMLKEKDFFLKAVEILRRRKYYSNKIWVLGYYHNDLVTISEYEQSETSNAGNVFNNLPIFEYFPYYSSRVHKFLNENKSTIRNDQFKKTYFNFLFVGLLSQPTSSRSRATFIYYLLLQDRIDEAYSVLSLLSEKEREEHEIQFDYIESFIDMYRGFPSFSKARKISEKYLDYPVKAWQRLFKEISDTLKEYDSEEVVEEVKTVEFSATVVNEGSQLKLSIPANTSVEVYIYGLNLELYFSEFPFTDFNTLTTKTIPNSIKTFASSNSSREEKIIRAAELKDCFVEVYSSTDGSRKKKVSSILWSNPNIKVNIKEKNGLAQVFYENKKQPGCYVKVYQNKNGVESFYRDGYTDITGTFKYALTDLDGVTEFVILFITENGGVVHRVNPPSQQGYFA